MELYGYTPSRFFLFIVILCFYADTCIDDVATDQSSGTCRHVH